MASTAVPLNRKFDSASLAEGVITVTEHSSPFGTPLWREYTWEGGPFVTFTPGGRGMPEIPRKPGVFFRLGPYLLYSVEWRETNILQRFLLCVRADSPRGWLYAACRPVVRLWDQVYPRSIATLAVWGLAEWHEYEVPSWRHVPLLARLARLVRR